MKFIQKWSKSYLSLSVYICVVYLPVILQVKHYLVDHVIHIQETLDIFKDFLPDKDKHMQGYTLTLRIKTFF